MLPLESQPTSDYFKKNVMKKICKVAEIIVNSNRIYNTKNIKKCRGQIERFLKRGGA
jgi:hypothetical protein